MRGAPCRPNVNFPSSVLNAVQYRLIWPALLHARGLWRNETDARFHR